MTTIALAVLAGGLLGYLLERGDFCFHSTLKGLFSTPKELDLFRAYLTVLVVATPLVALMISQGWIQPWIAPFAWQANLVGGLIFGAGMVVAATCVTGLFYKLGHGMLGTLVGLATWALGDWLAYVGPLTTIRARLNGPTIEAAGNVATLANIAGSSSWLIPAVLGAAILIYLWRSPRPSRGKLLSWLPLGVAIGLMIPLAWILAEAGGSDYPYGTSGVPTRIIQALGTAGVDGNPWIPITLVSLIPGALIASVRTGTFRARGETMRRYLQLATGGLMMGVAAGIAGGCNLGHSLVGVPLLSLGSITTTLSMAAGVFIALQVRKAMKTR
jgi:hypothetical protein